MLCRSLIGALLLAVGPAAAQIATDGSLGAAVDLPGTGRAEIAPTLGQRMGGNLFHSFERFSVADGAAAVFGVPDGVTRVISRVTGAAVSRIDGIVSINDATFSRLARADFWLMNPNGVLVGERGQFRTGGALFLSAGDAIGFADGTVFAADASARLQITTAAPESFGFLAHEPGRVALEGATLPVEGAMLALAGGEVTLDGGAVFNVVGGTTLLAAGERGETVVLSSPADAPTPAGGRIRLLGGPPTVTGAPGGSVTSTAGGDAILRAGTVELRGGAVLSEARGGAGGAIRIEAGRLIVDDGGSVASVSTGSAPAGAVSVRAGEIALTRGGAVRSQAQAAGDAGAISATGFRSLLIDRGGDTRETAIESEVAPGATGDAGDVLIAGGAVTLRDAGRIFSASFGDGDAGLVSVDVDSFVAEGGGQIGGAVRDVPPAPGAPAPRPARGAGGAVAVTAAGSVTLTGVRRDLPPGEPEPSGFFSGTEGVASGPGGPLTVRAETLTLTDEAEIGAETFNASPAGDVLIAVGALRLAAGAEITNTGRAAGSAGATTIRVRGAASVTDGAEIASRARGSGGRAGVVSVSAGTLEITRGGRVTTDSLATGGGSLAIATQGLTLIDGGFLTTSVRTSDGAGGAIRTDGPSLVLRGGAAIQANAEAGEGGRVTIANGVVVQDPTSVIEADSRLGQDGSVLVLGVSGAQTTEAEALPTAFFDAFALIDDACVAALAGGSALTVEGRGGAPFTGAALPGLFGGAIPYPAGGTAPRLADRDASGVDAAVRLTSCSADATR